MAFVVLLMMLTACAATPQEVTKTVNVRLTTSTQNLSAVTVCLRSITDLSRSHSLFSLATPFVSNGFLIFKSVAKDMIELIVKDKKAEFVVQDYRLNMWHTLCSTWDSTSGLVQLWFDGKPSIRKFVGRSNITRPIIVLGQEQDSYGGGFDIQQSFIGMISDVHVWDYTLSPCEIQRYEDSLNFTPGNTINWRALELQTTGRVLIEDQQLTCH